MRGIPAKMSHAKVIYNWACKYVLAQPYLWLLSKFKPGTVVRVAMRADPNKTYEELKAKSTFCNLNAKWTKELYTVSHQDGYKLKLQNVPNRRFSPRDSQNITNPHAIDVRKPWQKVRLSLKNNA